MSDKKFTPLMLFHLILMVVLIIMCIKNATTVHSKISLMSEPDEITTAQHIVAFNVLSMLALCFGVIYLLMRYNKKSALFYKAFFVMTAIETTGAYVLIIVKWGQQTLFALSSYLIPLIVMMVTICILLFLAFWKNLGKKRSFILFAILLIMDIVFGHLFLNRPEMIVTLLSRLAIDVTIGLAIKGKYDDKAARGTI